MVRSITTLGGALVALSLAIWWVFGDRIEESVQKMAGTAIILEEVTKVQTEQKVQRQVLADLTNRMNEIEPIPLVAIFDPLRSYVHNPCELGEVCEYTYRVRRSSFGENCSAPTSQRRFVDSTGNKFVPSREGVERPSKLDTDWNVIKGNFIVPEDATTGIGEFYMILTYRNCGPDRDQKIEMESTYLQVEVIE